MHKAILTEMRVNVAYNVHLYICRPTTDVVQGKDGRQGAGYHKYHSGDYNQTPYHLFVAITRMWWVF